MNIAAAKISLYQRLVSLNWPLLGLSALALGLRLFRIDFRSIWLDEAYSLRLASAGWRGILQGAAMDIHPPLFHLMLAGWIRVFGTSEWALRAFSALPGCLLVPVAYALGRAWSGPRAAWWCAGLAAVSPYFIELARSGRMGSWLALFSLLSIWFFWRLLQTDSKTNLAGYFLATAAAMYTHYFGFLVFFAEHFYRFVNLRKLHCPRPVRRHWMLAQLGLLAVYMPWLAVLVEHVTQGGPSWRGVGAPWWEAFHSLYAFIFGTSLWTWTDKLISLSALAASGVLAIWSWRAPQKTNHEETPVSPPALGLALTLLVVPLGLVWIYSQHKLNIFDNRYLSASAWVVLFFMATGFSRLPRPAGIAAAGLLLISFSVPLYNQWFVHGYFDDWRFVSRRILAQAQPGDVIAIYPAWNENPLQYYLRERLPVQGLPGAYDPITGVTEDYFYIDAVSVDRVSQKLPVQQPVWLVLVNENESEASLRHWFEKHYRLEKEQRMGSILIQRYLPGVRP